MRTKSSSAAGKTQICFQLALMAQLPRGMGGLGGGVLYVSTDHRFHVQRFKDLAHHFTKLHSGLDSDNLLQNVHVQEVRDLDTQLRLISIVIPLYLSQNPFIKLVIVDSVGCNYRCEEQHSALRAEHVYEMGSALKRIASHYNVVVFCTNQVSDVFQETTLMTISTNRGKDHFVSTSTPAVHRKKPALGLPWSNCITTRLQVSKTHTQEQDGVITTDRDISIVFSSYSAEASFPFIITHHGIQEI